LCCPRWWLSLLALRYFIADLLLFVSFLLNLIIFDRQSYVQFAGRDLQA
ncbi:unnamed protein product, partial [Brassica rapa subsp. trilocularis]